jgi:hypothetical protein
MSEFKGISDEWRELKPLTVAEQAAQSPLIASGQKLYH